MALMVFMKDLGTSLLFFGALLALLYVATGRFFYVLVGLVLFLAGATVLYFIFPHVQTRVDIWLRSLDRTRAARATRSSSRCSPWPAVGCSERGLGQGYLILQSGHTIIPHLETDFIFSAIGEELGLVGAAGIILLYLIFIYRGFRVAVRAKDDFSPPAGHGAHQHLRAAGLPHHRWGHQADPSHRDHPALRELRRQLDRGELRALALLCG